MDMGRRRELLRKRLNFRSVEWEEALTINTKVNRFSVLHAQCVLGVVVLA